VESKGSPPHAEQEQECTSHGQTTTIQTPKTVLPSDTLPAVFDHAAQYSADPRGLSRLATLTVAQMLKRAPGMTTSLSPLGSYS